MHLTHRRICIKRRWEKKIEKERKLVVFRIGLTIMWPCLFFTQILFWWTNPNNTHTDTFFRLSRFFCSLSNFWIFFSFTKSTNELLCHVCTVDDESRLKWYNFTAQLNCDLIDLRCFAPHRAVHQYHLFREHAIDSDFLFFRFHLSLSQSVLCVCPVISLAVALI